MKTPHRALRLFVIALSTLAFAACGSDGEHSGNNISSTNNTSPDADKASDAEDDADAEDDSDAEGASDAGDSGGELPDEVTYYQHVKPIMDGRCVSCHYDGGIAPFALSSYEETKQARAGVRAQVSSRQMPPWLAADGCNEYKHDVSLTDRQIALLERWVDQEAPEGDADNPGDPLPDVGGGLSRVDLTLEMPEAYTPRQSPDDYRCFPIEWPEDATQFVTGFGVEPGQQSIVHHVIAYVADPSLSDEIADKAAAEEGPGYTCFGGPGVGTQDPTGDQSASWLGSWAPGGQGQDFVDGTGIEIEPGSTVILQVHYNTLTADAVADQSAVELKLADEVDTQAMYLPWTNPQWLDGDNMLIPAGSPDTTHSWGFDLVSFAGSDITIYDASMHMHNLGDSARLWIDRASGDDDCLLDVPRWDFDWQLGYRLEQPLTVSSGDRLSIECQWDNTAENQPVVDGERLDPRDVTWGDGTTDEMCLGIFYVSFAE
ncbi:MAG: monooxygenase [Persicimonas sp.]